MLILERLPCFLTPRHLRIATETELPMSLPTNLLTNGSAISLPWTGGASCGSTRVSPPGLDGLLLTTCTPVCSLVCCVEITLTTPIEWNVWGQFVVRHKSRGIYAPTRLLTCCSRLILYNKPSLLTRFAHLILSRFPYTMALRSIRYSTT